MPPGSPCPAARRCRRVRRDGPPAGLATLGKECGALRELFCPAGEQTPTRPQAGCRSRFEVGGVSVDDLGVETPNTANDKLRVIVLRQEGTASSATPRGRKRHEEFRSMNAPRSSAPAPGPPGFPAPPPRRPASGLPSLPRTPRTVAGSPSSGAQSRHTPQVCRPLRGKALHLARITRVREIQITKSPLASTLRPGNHTTVASSVSPRPGQFKTVSPPIFQGKAVVVFQVGTAMSPDDVAGHVELLDPSPGCSARASRVTSDRRYSTLRCATMRGRGRPRISLRVDAAWLPTYGRYDRGCR